MSMKFMARALLMAVSSVVAVSGANFWASPAGAASGTGSLSRPWDITTALTKTAVIKPGDTLYLRGGTYFAKDKLVIHVKLKGQTNQPITIRPYRRERVILDGGVQVHFAWIVMRDMEVLNSRTKRVTNIAGSVPADILRPAGFAAHAPNVKIINNIIHDAGSGLAGWERATDTEFYGNIVYNNGWKGPDRGHGHGAYGQNLIGKQYLTDNIIFNQFDAGLHLYGSSASFLNGFHVEGNIVFNNGGMGGNYSRNILMGGTAVVNNAIVRNNYTYYPRSTVHDGDNNFGYFAFGAGCSNMALTGNFFVSGGSAMTLHKCQLSSFSGNTLVGPVRNFSAASYPGNTYFAPPSIPSGASTAVRPNQHEPGRAHIVVFNWNRASSVGVNISSAGLNFGDQWELRDVQNVYGPPIAAGAYTGGAISIPMTSTAVSQPIGTVPFPPVHTSSEFGAFLLTKVTPEPPPPPPLTISNVKTVLSGYTATLTWDSSNPAGSEFKWGTNPGYGKTLPANVTPKTSHRMALTALSARVTYNWRGFSRDDHGQEADTGNQTFTIPVGGVVGSTPPPPPPPPPGPGPTPTPGPPPANPYSVYNDAENGVRVQFPIVQDVTTSGRKYIYSEQSESGYVVYNVYVPQEGTYFMWGRVKAPSAAAASFYWSLNSEAGDIYDTVQAPYTNTWKWTRVNGRAGAAPLTLNPRSFVMRRGWHKLYIRGRQAGSAIDGFLITNIPSLVPTDATFGAF